MKRNAFTLAEVLITLGIIGVVASMTLPTLIQNNKNKEVEARLKKVYSVMNQAIMMSEKDNGPKEYWDFTCTTDEENNANEDCGKGIEKYFAPYVKTTKVETFTNALGFNTALYFGDGSILVGKINTNGKSYNALDFYFYPNGKNFNKETFGSSSEEGTERKDCGITFFAFRFAPADTNTNNKFHLKKGFEPYKYALDELTHDELTGSHEYACTNSSRYKVFCTALIQLNGWQIPDDYPFKVK